MATRGDFAIRVLVALRVPATLANTVALVAQARAESTQAKNNPLATTRPWFGATAYNSVGVRNYPSLDAGVGATALTYLNGNYGAVLDAMKAGVSTARVLEAIKQSPWSGTPGYEFDPIDLELSTRADWGVYAGTEIPT